jgi:hypothetical protein
MQRVYKRENSTFIPCGWLSIACGLFKRQLAALRRTRPITIREQNVNMTYSIYQFHLALPHHSIRTPLKISVHENTLILQEKLDSQLD